MWKTTALGFCVWGLLVACAFGYSTDGSALTRVFDKANSRLNEPIQVTVTFTNAGTNTLRGIGYTEQVPSGIVVSPINVTLNGAAVTNYTFEVGQEDDVFAGYVPCRWVLETPTNFAEANPIPPQGTLQIIYSINSATPGSFVFSQFSWDGYSPNISGATFGYSEVADQQIVTFANAILTVTADNLARPYGITNPPLTFRYSGFVNGDDTNVLSGRPALSTVATSESPAGAYLIMIDQGTLSSTNYGFNFVNGTLTVTASSLAITSVRVTNHIATITWNSVPGLIYRVEYKSSLADANWSHLPPDVMAIGATTSKTDVIGGSPQRFYRVVLLDVPAGTPLIQSLHVNDGVAVITWSSLAGQTYQVQSVNSLADASWTDMPLEVTATGPTTSATNVVGSLPRRFYRVQLVQTP